LNDIAFPGLNEVSDFLNDQVIRFIKEQRRNWRRVRNILEESRENPQIPPTNPEPNFTLPIDPQWRDTDEITVIYGGTSFIDDDGWQWLPGAPLSSLFPHWGVIDDYALITIQDRTRMINASLLFDSNFEDPPLYYLYTSFTFSVRDLRTVNGRVDRLARVTNSIDEPCTPIDVITPSGSWSPDFEPSPPLEQEFEIVPIINRRLRRIIEEREERERMSCDLSPIMVALRRIIATNVNLSTQVTQTHLQINANIDELKPPVATINATTQATSTTVNSVDNVVNNTATRVQNIASKLDDVGNLVQRTFDKVGEVFQEITKRIDKWSKWFRLPMLLDALSFILLLHNAAMLSANVVQTVGEILNTGLQIIGLKSPDGEDFEVFNVVGKQADDFMSSILGQENWTKTKTTWKKLNNIYQAAANVINSMQSIIDSARSIMELGAEMTGKIGNALRRAGVVFENAFNWFPEQINAATARQTKLNGMIQGIQNIEDVASSLSSAVSEVKSIQDTVIEMREQRQKFNEAVSELVSGKTEAEADSKAKSQSPTIQPSDLRPDHEGF
jgi:ABC-type transporter Mla subunit MlaD